MSSPESHHSRRRDDDSPRRERRVESGDRKESSRRDSDKKDYYQREKSKQDESQKNEFPPLQTVLRGKVVSIQSYGAFVQLEGYTKQGLVHISQVSKHRIEGKEDLEKILDVGKHVYVKEDGKVNLSMKYVSQTDGIDLDTNNVDYSMNQQKRKPSFEEKKPISIGAVLNTQCKKCKGYGHLSSECYSIPGGSYEMIKSPPRESNSEKSRNEPEKDKKRKKEKKEKKEKKDKKEKKHKKHKKNKSSSESD